MNDNEQLRPSIALYSHIRIPLLELFFQALTESLKISRGSMKFFVQPGLVSLFVTATILLLPAGNSEKINFVSISNLDFSNREPHGYLKATKERLYIAREPAGSGFVVGSYNPSKNTFSYVDQSNDRAVTKTDVTQTMVINYNGAVVSWRLVDNLEGIVAVQNHIISAGKGRDGTEDVYVCRCLYREHHLYIGYYLLSNPTCKVVHENTVQPCNIFEVMSVSMHGDLFDVRRP